jgi:hypothetical protein
MAKKITKKVVAKTENEVAPLRPFIGTLRDAHETWRLHVNKDSEHFKVQAFVHMMQRLVDTKQTYTEGDALSIWRTYFDEVITMQEVKDLFKRYILQMAHWRKIQILDGAFETIYLQLN